MYTLPLCPHCGADIIPGAIFCGQCRQQIRTDVAVTNPGTDVNKYQLLGSLCPNCSSAIPPDSGYCHHCSQAVKPAPPPPPPPTLRHDTPPINNNQVTPNPDNTARNVLIGVGGVLLLLFIVVIASNIPKSSNNSNYNTNTTGYTSYTNSNSSRTTTVSLPDSFERTYRGTIAGQTFSMTLTKSYRDLRGTASTSRSSDTLSGSIDSDGRFRLDGYENGVRFTGIYTGQINANGTITGYWTTPAGTKETSFYLDQY